MTWIDSHAGDAEQHHVALFDWLLGGTNYRRAAHDVPVVTAGTNGAPAASWTGLPFEFDVQQDSATLSIPNGYHVIGSGVTSAEGSTIVLYEAWLDPAGLTHASQQERIAFSGRVNAWQIDDQILILHLVPADLLATIRLPRRPVTPLCGYVEFKGTSCGYAGATTSCDRTLGTCQSLFNSARFGGWFRLDARS